MWIFRGIQNYLKLLFCKVLLLKQKMFLVVSIVAMKCYRNRNKHSISNIFILCIVSFNAFWFFFKAREFAIGMGFLGG